MELLSLFNIPEALPPKVCLSGEILGECRVPGLEGIPISGVAGDQQAALFGQGCWKSGMAKVTYRTGAFALLHTGESTVQSDVRLVTTRAAQLSKHPQYALEGRVFNTGSVVQWLRDGLNLIDSSSEVEALARSVESSDGALFVPALTGLGAPHWAPNLRGALFGLTRGTEAGHIARAALEGIACQVNDVLAAMERAVDATHPNHSR